MALQIISQEHALSHVKEFGESCSAKFVGKVISFPLEKELYELDGATMRTDDNEVLPEGTWCLVIRVELIDIGGLDTLYIGFQLLYEEKFVWVIMDMNPKTRFSDGYKLLGER